MLVHDIKGISEFTSHILIIAVAIVILALVASSMHNYYRDMVLESQQAEARVLSEKLGDEILEMYSKYEKSEVEPEKGENTTLASSTIGTPEGIAGRNYEIYLNSSKSHWINAELLSVANISVLRTKRPTARIVVKVTEFPEKTYNYLLYNIETNLTGFAKRPNKVELKYIRKNDGNITDLIEMERAS